MAWAERRGRKWRGLYRDAEGRKRVVGQTDSKKTALELAQREEHKIHGGDWHDPDAGKITFSEYFEKSWLPNRILEPTTYGGYQTYYRTEVKPAFGDMELRKINRGLVQRWVIDMRRRGVSPATVRRKFAFFKVVLDGREGVSAVRDGLIHTSPCDGIDLPKMKRRKVTVYPITAVDTLMTRLDEWWEIMVLVMADTGMRWGEVQGLEVRDFTGSAFNVERTVVELTKKVLTELGIGQGQFYVKDYPKDGEDRLVTLSPEVAVRVEQVIKHRELFPGDRIFGMHDRHGKLLRTEAWPTGRPVVRSHFRTVWRAAHGDDIPILKVHALRGSMISWLVLGGTDLGAVMTRAGHSRLATTQGYFDQFSDADQRALAGLARARAVARGTV